MYTYVSGWGPRPVSDIESGMLFSSASQPAKKHAAVIIAVRE